MNINLPEETMASLAHYVTQGEFASLEEAPQQILAEYVAARESEDEPELEQMLDEGLAQIERGEVVTWEEYRAQADAMLARFKTKAYGAGWADSRSVARSESNYRGIGNFG